MAAKRQNAIWITVYILSFLGALAGISHSLIYGTATKHSHRLEDLNSGLASLKTTLNRHKRETIGDDLPQAKRWRRGSIRLVVNGSAVSPSAQSTDVAFAPAPGQQSQILEKLFRFHPGRNRMTVLRSGLYAFIVQVVFQPEGEVGAAIFLNDDSSPYRKCVVSSQIYPGGDSPVFPTYGTCKIFATAYLSKGSTVSMAISGTQSPIITKQSMTFWQVIRIGNTRLIL